MDFPSFKNKAALTTAEAIQGMVAGLKKPLQLVHDQYKLRADKKRRFKSFQKGYVVMAHLNKGRTPVGIYLKLQGKKIGPLKVQHKINDNAYVLVLPSHFQISPMFNVADLFEYFPPNGVMTFSSNRVKCFSRRGTDAGALV